MTVLYQLVVKWLTLNSYPRLCIGIPPGNKDLKIYPYWPAILRDGQWSSVTKWSFHSPWTFKDEVTEQGKGETDKIHGVELDEDLAEKGLFQLTELGHDTMTDGEPGAPGAEDQPNLLRLRKQTSLINGIRS